MHVYFLMDGAEQYAQDMLNRLTSYRYEVKDSAGKSWMVPLNVSIPRLVCLRFHKQVMNEILSLIAPYQMDTGMNMQLALLRKLLGLKHMNRLIAPVPGYDHRWVNVQMLGWKPDKTIPKGTEWSGNCKHCGRQSVIRFGYGDVESV